MNYVSCLPSDPVDPFLPSVDVYSAEGRVMLVPGVRNRRGGVWALSSDFREVALGSPKLGDVACEVLSHSRAAEAGLPPDSNSIELEIATLFRVPVSRVMWRKIKFGRILGQTDDSVVLYPSRRGALHPDMETFRALPVAEELDGALRRMLDLCEL